MKLFMESHSILASRFNEKIRRRAQRAMEARNERGRWEKERKKKKKKNLLH